MAIGIAKPSRRAALRFKLSFDKRIVTSIYLQSTGIHIHTTIPISDLFAKSDIHLQQHPAILASTSSRVNLFARSEHLLQVQNTMLRD